MVIVAREDRRAIFEYLLKEGVIVVKKDAYLPAHQHVSTVPNLHVMMVTKSLKSRGCINEVYTWGWHYYFLTKEGLAYLLKELGLEDSKILPATYAKKIRKAIDAPEGEKVAKVDGDAEEKAAPVTKGEV